jgi:hypothetical protein
MSSLDEAEGKGGDDGPVGEAARRMAEERRRIDVVGPLATVDERDSEIARLRSEVRRAAEDMRELAARVIDDAAVANKRRNSLGEATTAAFVVLAEVIRALPLPEAPTG